jgi:hypothetical protein
LGRQILLDTLTGVDPSGCFPLFAICSSSSVCEVAANALGLFVLVFAFLCSCSVSSSLLSLLAVSSSLSPLDVIVASSLLRWLPLYSFHGAASASLSSSLLSLSLSSSDSLD